MVIAALGLVAFLGIASLAIDMGRLYAVRNELQNNADAAALAACNSLVVTDASGNAMRDATAAQTAAMTVAQRQSQLLGQTAVANGSRNDLTVTFGQWDIYAASPDTAWTDMGTTCGAYSNANGVRVVLQRATGLNYGPVTTLLADVMGSQFQVEPVSVTATAYLGFALSTVPGGVDLPLAVPDTVITAANPQPKPWYARWLGPSEAIAVAPPTLTFKDLASTTFYQSNTGKPLVDTTKAYLVLVGDAGKNDAVPDTINYNLSHAANGSSGTPVRAMSRGTQLYPISEYQWASNINTIFNNFKTAYNAKKNASGKYKVVVPVYSTTNPLASRYEKSWKALAGLFSFGPSPAYACFQFKDQTYPDTNRNIYVDGITSVNVTNVTVLTPVSVKTPSSGSQCSDCSSYSSWGYATQADCMVNNPKSCRNLDSITVEIPTGSTISNPGTTSGGPDNKHINPSGSAGTGAFSTMARLVK